MRLATTTSLFHNRREGGEAIGYIESMRRCKAAGFDVLDLNMSAMQWEKNVFAQEDWQYQADRIREAAETIQVTFCQSHTPYRLGKFVHFPTQEEDDFFDEITRRSIIVSGMLGVSWAVIHPVTASVDSEYRLEDNISLNHEVYDAAVVLAEKEHVGIAFENMCDSDNKRRFAATTEELKSLVDSWKGANVGACWDIGHGNRTYVDSVRPLKEMGSYIKALHVDDNHGVTDEHLLPFQGKVHWEEIMQTLKEIGYQGDFVYELSSNDHIPDALKDSVARLAVGVGQYLLAL